MTRRIFRAIFLAAAGVLLASFVIIMSCLYDYFGLVHQEQLRDELELAAYGVEQSGAAYLDMLQSKGCRVTWVAADGTVLFDTRADAGQMENHGEREEIRQALETGEGSSTRFSSTLTEKTLYLARRLSDGTVLRISASHMTTVSLVLGMLQPVLIVAVIAFVLSAALASRMSKRIVEPLNRLDLEHPMDNDTYEELAPLLNRIHRQHRQISAQLRELRERTEEFEQIIRHMKECFVLLDSSGTVLSMNPAASELFHADFSCIGQHFLNVDRSRSLSLAVEKAMAGGHSETRETREGREYQFDISRIEGADGGIGAVLLAFDVTEQARAEQSRREFTANVSHELKTPLQSIIGSAELLENGLVKQEDIPQFVSRIHREAARLVALIEDIIQLSQLDEQAELREEPINLSQVAGEAADELRDIAALKGVRLSFQGEPVMILGVPGLIHEMIYNLCDNAIKYNVEAGSVSISVSAEADKALLRIADTGIGIPAEYQDRVFERFFRVDKSRSKSTGGTGLGLSIVKHIAQLHHAKIDLQSKPGVGTQISVVFRLNEATERP